jgi:hypothetical protein
VVNLWHLSQKFAGLFAGDRARARGQKIQLAVTDLALAASERLEDTIN